jgi:hypothetical protein
MQPDKASGPYLSYQLRVSPPKRLVKGKNNIMKTMIPKPNWLLSNRDRANTSTVKIFEEGTQYGAEEICKLLLGLASISSEDMFRELVAISEGKAVTGGWDE